MHADQRGIYYNDFIGNIIWCTYIIIVCILSISNQRMNWRITQVWHVSFNVDINYIVHGFKLCKVILNCDSIWRNARLLQVQSQWAVQKLQVLKKKVEIVSIVLIPSRLIWTNVKIIDHYHRHRQHLSWQLLQSQKNQFQLRKYQSQKYQLQKYFTQTYMYQFQNYQTHAEVLEIPISEDL